MSIKLINGLDGDIIMGVNTSDETVLILNSRFKPNIRTEQIEKLEITVEL